jgi:hypothetical protein
LPEWKAVDTKAPAWALRHYRRIYDPEKKVSVISLGPLENKLGDDSAVGLVYNAPSSGVSQTLYYLSSNRRAIEIARGRWEWEDEGLSAPTVDRISSGVFRVVAHPRSSDAIGSFILLLLAALGFEIAL